MIKWKPMLHIFIVCSCRFYRGRSFSSRAPIGDDILASLESREEYLKSKTKWEVGAIGRVESPYKSRFGTPKQATIERGQGLQQGRIVLFPGYEECLDQLDGFDYLWLLTFMHLNTGFKKRIRPQPRGDKSVLFREVGLFCSRAPHRPNPIALSALKISSVDVKSGIIEVVGLDLLDGTPVLDIKPYVPAFDSFPDARAGWMDQIMPAEAGRIQGYQEIRSKRGEKKAIKKGKQVSSEKEVSDDKEDEIDDSDVDAENGPNQNEQT